MSIPFEHTLDVPQDSLTVFAFLDDLSLTPQWLGPCISLTKMSPGPNAVGDKLRYEHEQAGRRGVMDGEITARDPGSRLAYRYWDSSFEVTTEFRMAPAGSGTRLTHLIVITPLSFMTKMMAPMIRGALPKQTIDAMEKVKEMLAARG